MKQNAAKYKKKILSALCVILFLNTIPLLIVANGEFSIFYETYAKDGGENRIESVIQSSDSGYILAGTRYAILSERNVDAFLIKTDANGKEQWTQRYEALGTSSVHSVAETDDGGYIMAGSKISTINKTIIINIFNFTLVDHPDSNCLLIKAFPNGAIQWIKTFDGGGWGDGAYCAIQTSDGGYAIAGWLGTWFIEDPESGINMGDHTYSQVWLIKTDEYGNIEWNQTYGGVKGGSGRSLVQTSDGGYAILGGYNSSRVSGKNDFLLIRTDPKGMELWSRQYGGLSEDYGYFIVQSSDGGFALTGTMGYWNEVNNVVSYGFLLVKTDSDGILEWEQRFGEAKLGTAYAVVETIDGGFALAGSRVLVKTDQNGSMLWNQSYIRPREGDFNIYSMIESIDGGFALGGSISRLYGILIKTDKNGISTVTSSPITPTPTSTISPSPSQEPQGIGSFEMALAIALIGIVFCAGIVFIIYLLKKS